MGCNYFGHAQGYTPAWDNNLLSVQPPFLHYKGGYVDEKNFQAGCSTPTGKYPQSRVFPIIWAEQWIVGQNALDHNLPNYGDSDGFKNTVNFILPPAALAQGAYNLNFEVHAEISSVFGDIGKPGGNDLWLTGGTIKFSPPPKRKFTVSVSPVHVYGLCSGKGNIP